MNILHTASIIKAASQENDYKFYEGAQKRMSLFPVIKPSNAPLKTSPEKAKETDKRVRLPAIVRL